VLTCRTLPSTPDSLFELVPPPTHSPALPTDLPPPKALSLRAWHRAPPMPTPSSTLTTVSAHALPVLPSPTLLLSLHALLPAPTTRSTLTVLSPPLRGPPGRGTLTLLDKRLLVSALPVFRHVLLMVCPPVLARTLSRYVPFHRGLPSQTLMVQCIDTRSELESCGGCLNGSADTLAGLSPLGVE
jgi:hypothetical protein